MKKLLNKSFLHLFVRIFVLSGIFLQSISGIYAAPQFMDYFTAMPIIGSLSSTCWGAAAVGARDQSNGLEDKAISRYCYWDGAIIKGPDGVYHMFASRWDQSQGHNGWFGSQAVHATSNNLCGPYTDQGLVWPNDANGQGHNVLALVLKDGRYAVYCSETRRPAVVYVSTNLNGPWTKLGTVSVTGSSSSGFTHSNVYIMLRPDGRYGIISRDGLVGVANDILGPYNITGSNIYTQAAGMPTGNVEDPCMWYSGGLYHVVANKWDTRKAYHLTSTDGISNWKLTSGYAYDQAANFVRYTNGTVNHWNKLERFNVYMENSHITAVTLAVLDVAKDAELGNDQHGSKVIVVPFDGVSFDGSSSPTPTPTPTPTSPTPTPQQSPVWTGGPYTLNGTSDYVDLPDGLTNNLGDFSVACWVKLNTLTNWVRIFDFGGDTNVFMMLTPQSGTTGYPYFAITTTGNSGEQGLNGTSALPTGTWQHLAVVKSGNTGILYINKQEVARNTSMALRPADLGATTNNYIGKSQWSQDPYLNGNIDQFKIYNRSLSAAEVTALGSNPPGGVTGDVNGDGNVTIVDAMLIAQYVSGLNPAGFISANADVNCDGSININDALLVARYAAGLLTKLGC